MRLLLFTHYTGLYGANRSLLGILKVFKNFDIEMLVVIPNKGEICYELDTLNIEYKVLNFTPWVKKKLNPRKLLIPRIKQKIQIFLEFVKTYKYKKEEEIIAYNSLKSFEPELIYSNSSTINIGFQLSQRFKCKHVWHIRELGNKHYEMYYFYKISFVKKSFKESDLLIVISKAVKEYYENFTQNKNIELLYDGIYTKNEFELIQNRKSKESDLVTFGIVGLLSKNKHQETAIKAFKLVHEKHKNTRLIIVGAGDNSKLLDLVNLYGLDSSVEFLGFVYKTDNVYLDIDILLMCSEFEAMGRVTLEAMAFGIPIIGNYSGGTKDLIIDGVNGYFYYNNNYDQLASKMIFLLKNKLVCSILGKKGREIFKDNYLLENYCKRLYCLFNKLNEI